MKTETEMLDVILANCKSATGRCKGCVRLADKPKGPKDEFQDYDVAYLVENFEDLNFQIYLGWTSLAAYHWSSITYLTIAIRISCFSGEDGNRIDLTLCPKNTFAW